VAAAEEERAPCIGAVLTAVNGVRTQGLSFQNVLDLLQTQQVLYLFMTHSIAARCIQ
jgi:hypothetical protein